MWQHVTMVYGLPFPGFEPGSHRDGRKRRQPDGVVETAVIGIGRESHYLERINMDVKGMYSVGIVDQAPFLRGSDFYGRVDFILLVQLAIDQVLESIDDSPAAGFHRECYGTSRHDLGVVYRGVLPTGNGQFFGYGHLLGL